MILTSYFANYRNFPKNRRPISISRYSPKWFKGEEAKELAPLPELLSDYKEGLVNDKEYEERYRKEVLSKLDPKEIVKKYADAVFLCYETPDEFCHRQIVSKWLKESGIESEELDKNKLTKIAVIGSRTFNDYSTASFYLKKLINNYHNVKLISGGATGADSIAEQFAKENNIEIEIYKPNWELHGKSAGFKRNYEIWDNADIGIAFWDGESKGTEHSFEISFNQGKDLFIYNEKIKGFQPREIKKDILKIKDKYNVICFTANSIVKKDGALVMGAGNAKAFRDKFSGIDKKFGSVSQNFGFKVIEFNGVKIGAFQTKVNYKDPSTKEIISNSVKELKRYIKENPRERIALCYPGISNGGLTKEEVRPLLKGLKVDLFYL
jgi:uncharacterized protein YeaO (DUF488 family)